MRVSSFRRPVPSASRRLRRRFWPIAFVLPIFIVPLVYAILTGEIVPRPPRETITRVVCFAAALYAILAALCLLAFRHQLIRGALRELDARNSRDLGFLQNAVRNLAGHTESTGALGTLLEGLRASAGFSSLGLYLLDESSPRPVLTAAAGLSSHEWPHWQALADEDELLGRLDPGEQPLAADDLADLPEGAGSWLVREGYHGFLLATLAAGGRRTGLLLAASRQRHRPNRQDWFLIHIFIDHLALAVEHRQLAQRFTELDGHYRRVIDYGRFLVFTLGVDGRFASLGETWEPLLGLPPQTLVGQKILEWLHPGDAAAFEEGFLTALKGTSVDLPVFRYCDGAGGWRFLQARLSPSPRGSGGVGGIARDITDLHVTHIQRNQALRALQIFNDLRLGQNLPDQLEAVLARIGELCEVQWLVLLLETAGPPRYGWSATGEEDWADLLDPRMRRAIDERLKRDDFCFGADLHEEFAAYATDQTGRPRLAYEAVSVREAGGAYHGALVLAREAIEPFNSWDEIPLRLIANQLGNLIARKYLESQILIQNRELAERSRRATEATRLKSRFLSSISHELRTPLHAIIGFTEVVMHKTPTLPARRRRNLETVLRNAQHLLAMIGDLLDLTRIEAGKVKIQTENFLLAEVIEDVAMTLRPLAYKKQLALRTLIGDPQLRIVTDRAKVRQILINLVSNSIKFTAQGGVDIATRSEGNRIMIDVRDTGIGIAEEQLSLIFDEFSQVEDDDEEAQERPGGVGLGLTLSRKLARILGGNITVQSRLNEGSTFTLQLPVRIEWGQRPAESPRPPAPVALDLFNDDLAWEEFEVDNEEEPENRPG